MQVTNGIGGNCKHFPIFSIIKVAILGTSLSIACLGSILFINDAIDMNVGEITAILHLVGCTIVLVIALAGLACLVGI
jgi:hypothetical protein